MHIDDRVEERLREAFNGVLHRDGAAMANALQTLNLPETQHAVDLAYFITGHIVNEVHAGNPADADLASLARLIVKSEAGWITLEAPSVQKVIAAAARNEPVIPGLGREESMGLTVVVAAYLLAGFRRTDAGEEWFDYLDEVLDAYAATPDASTARTD